MSASDIPAGADDPGDAGVAITVATGDNVALRPDREHERSMRERTLFNHSPGADPAQRIASTPPNAPQTAFHNARGPVGVNPAGIYSGSPLANTPLPGPSGGNGNGNRDLNQRAAFNALRATQGRAHAGVTTGLGNNLNMAHHYPLYDPHLPTHPIAPTDRGERWRAPMERDITGNVAGGASIVITDTNFRLPHTRLRLTPDRHHLQQDGEGERDRTNAGAPRGGRRREVDGSGTWRNERDMVLE
jgi:hypothetical protein